PVFGMVDGVEVENGGTAAQENAFAAEVARYLGLPMIGGSDSHSANSLGHRATILHDSIRSVGDLVEALRAGRCVPIADPVGGGAAILSG
ncbi:MAG: hypothetical protein NZ518_10895, partial [Dehalococcoidia bacterium]|nr:hypothetical protein [Dehalococcoidia bacterium]